MKNVARFALEVKFPELADAIAAICAATSNEEVALEMLLGIYKNLLYLLW